MLIIFAKILKTLLAPANLFCLLLVFGGIAASSGDPRRQKIGRRLCLFLGALLFTAAVLPVGFWVLAPLENRFPTGRPDRVDGIILLGGDENTFLTDSRKQASVNVSARRYITFAGLAREYPKARLAFIGGNPELVVRSKLSTVDIAKPVLDAIGVKSDRVVFEDKSRNTYENAVFGKQVVKPSEGENWLLVTSASHMPRALLTFKKAGWNVHPAPTGFLTPKTAPFMLGFNVNKRLNELTVALYEYQALLAYWILGRIDNPWK